MIYTSALKLLGGEDALGRHSRHPKILADAAYLILSKDAKKVSGNFFIDEPLLKENGITDFEQYALKPGEQLAADIFVPEELMEGLIQM